MLGLVPLIATRVFEPNFGIQNGQYPLFSYKCCLLITFANSLDTYQARQKIEPDVDPICLTLRWYIFMNFFFEKVDFEKNQQTAKKKKKFPGSKELRNETVAGPEGVLSNPVFKNPKKKKNLVSMRPNYYILSWDI